MSREFAITPSAPSVSLDSSGRGEVTFTVSNTTALPMRARATLRGSSGLDGAWLKLRGSPARDMPPGSTETFTVDLQVPPGTPAGSHALSLVVVDVELPDEHYTESPKVAVEVGAPAPVEARAFPWWWVVLGAVLVAGLAFGAYALLRHGGPGEPLAGYAEPCGPERACAPGLSCVQDVCQCPEGVTWCDGQCVDLRSSDAHCGECGNSCPRDFACREGGCVRVDCPRGEALCGGRCFDTQTNDTHCGRCGNSCGEQEDCVRGDCRCREGLTRCGDRCVNLQTNDNSCGRCGNSCGARKDCREGICVVTRCDSGLSLCAGQCLDTETNNAHCGECGNSCPRYFACREGDCVRVACPPGETLCGGQCLNAQTNDNHCGECNNSCPRDFACQSGSCVRVGCDSGLTLCGNQCVTLQVNRNHCGECNNSCDSGELCRRGTCIPGITPDDICGGGQERCQCPGMLLPRCVPRGTCKCPERP